MGSNSCGLDRKAQAEAQIRLRSHTNLVKSPGAIGLSPKAQAAMGVTTSPYCSCCPPTNCPMESARCAQAHTERYKVTKNPGLESSVATYTTHSERERESENHTQCFSPKPYPSFLSLVVTLASPVSQSHRTRSDPRKPSSCSHVASENRIQRKVS